MLLSMPMQMVCLWEKEGRWHACRFPVSAVWIFTHSFGMESRDTEWLRVGWAFPMLRHSLDVDGTREHFAQRSSSGARVSRWSDLSRVLSPSVMRIRFEHPMGPDQSVVADR